MQQKRRRQPQHHAALSTFASTRPCTSAAAFQSDASDMYHMVFRQQWPLVMTAQSVACSDQWQARRASASAKSTLAKAAARVHMGSPRDYTGPRGAAALPISWTVHQYRLLARRGAHEVQQPRSWSVHAPIRHLWACCYGVRVSPIRSVVWSGGVCVCPGVPFSFPLKGVVTRH